MLKQGKNSVILFYSKPRFDAYERPRKCVDRKKTDIDKGLEKLQGRNYM